MVVKSLATGVGGKTSERGLPLLRALEKARAFLMKERKAGRSDRRGILMGDGLGLARRHRAGLERMIADGKSVIVSTARCVATIPDSMNFLKTLRGSIQSIDASAHEP
jgi:hypothetical protein